MLASLWWHQDQLCQQNLKETVTTIPQRPAKKIQPPKTKGHRPYRLMEKHCYTSSVSWLLAQHNWAQEWWSLGKAHSVEINSYSDYGCSFSFFQFDHWSTWISAPQKPSSSSSPISLHAPIIQGTGPAVPAGHLAPKPGWNTCAGPITTILFCTV